MQFEFLVAERARHLASVVLLLCATACSGGSKAPILANGGGNQSNGRGNGSGGSGNGSGGKASTDGGLDGSVHVIDCTSVDCGLHGVCSVDSTTNMAKCTCDKGYIVNAGSATGACIEDVNCIELRALECDARWGSPGSAIGITVSASYCSGRPDTGIKPTDLTVEEKAATEDWKSLPPETPTTVVDRKFASHVYFAVDVSQSIQDSKVLAKVATAISGMLDELAKTADPPRVAVWAFDGKPYLYPVLSETTDLAQAKTQLAAKLGSFKGRDPQATNLFGAVKYVLDKLERSIELKSIIDEDGLLSAGTAIIISDGDDETGTYTFQQTQDAIAAHVHKVITVGLGKNANFPKLTMLGRDGSFSVADPSMLSVAFDSVSANIKRFTDSLRFIGYCSPKRGNTFSARVRIKGSNDVVCNYDATYFTDGCSSATFDPKKECASLQCGDLLGCGECAAGQCCLHGQCMGPSTASKDADCGAEWMCDPALTCNFNAAPNVCATTVASSEACDSGSSLCDPDVDYCFSSDPKTMPTTCAPRGGIGTPCKTNEECASGHCDRDPDKPGANSYSCRPIALMFEHCTAGGSATSCEKGTYCDPGDSTCKAQLWHQLPCTFNAQCRSGVCEMAVGGRMVCAGEDRCYFPLQL